MPDVPRDPGRSPSQEDAAVLGCWADELARPGFAFGRWVRSGQRPDGAWSMPYMELLPVGLRFLEDAGRFVAVFDGRTWLAGPAGEAHRADRSLVAQAPADELIRLLTSLIRGDWYTEGDLLEASETGRLLAIAWRAAALAAAGLD